MSLTASVVVRPLETQTGSKSSSPIKTADAQIGEVVEHNECPPTTIDQLVHQRSLGSDRDAPIVAYPSTGTDYVNYTPHQVCQVTTCSPELPGSNADTAR